jgi:hypothetical protein
MGTLGSAGIAHRVAATATWQRWQTVACGRARAALLTRDGAPPSPGACGCWHSNWAPGVPGIVQSIGCSPVRIHHGRGAPALSRATAEASSHRRLADAGEHDPLRNAPPSKMGGLHTGVFSGGNQVRQRARVADDRELRFAWAHSPFLCASHPAGQAVVHQSPKAATRSVAGDRSTGLASRSSHENSDFGGPVQTESGASRVGAPTPPSPCGSDPNRERRSCALQLPGFYDLGEAMREGRGAGWCRAQPCTREPSASITAVKSHLRVVSQKIKNRDQLTIRALSYRKRPDRRSLRTTH